MLLLKMLKSIGHNRKQNEESMKVENDVENEWNIRHVPTERGRTRLT